VAAILAEILYEPLRPPSDRHGFGPAFDAWFLRACHHDSTQRFSSAVEQIEALARALGLPVEVQPRATTSGSLRDSLVTRSEGLLAPYATGGNGVSQSLNVAAPADQNESSLAPHGGTVPPSGSDMPMGNAGARRRWKVAGVLAAIAAAAVLLLVSLSERTGSPTPAPASKSGPGDDTATAVAVNPPSSPSAAGVVPPVDPAFAVTPPSSGTETRARPLVTVASAKKDVLHPPAVRATPPRTTVRREKWLFDEALGDQK
jgi:hypothetical protein